MSITDGPIRTLAPTSLDGGTADGSTLQPGGTLAGTELRSSGLTIGTEPIGVLPFPGPIVGLNPVISDAIPRTGAPGTQVVITGSNLPVDAPCGTCVSMRVVLVKT